MWQEVILNTVLLEEVREIIFKRKLKISLSNSFLWSHHGTPPVKHPLNSEVPKEELWLGGKEGTQPIMSKLQAVF